MDYQLTTCFRLRYPGKNQTVLVNQSNQEAKLTAGGHLRAMTWEWHDPLRV